MTVEMLKELIAEGKVREYHTATRRGYVSRRSNGKVEAYNGRYGEGFVHVTPRWDTTQYVHVTYYIYNR